MRYRGFNIVSTYADHISKYDSSNRVWGQAPGYYCEVFSETDDSLCNPLANFELLLGDRLQTLDEDEVEDWITKIADKEIDEWKLNEAVYYAERKNHLVGRLVQSATSISTYADYIATRPRAEKIGKHGLFSNEGDEIVLSQVSAELNRHEGNMWTMIVSLRREDAERLSFDNAIAWRELLRAHTSELADALKIPLSELKWYAAFHNEAHHPHIHLLAYCDDPSVGYLSKQGVRNMRSALGNDIFRDELQFIYREQTDKRDQLKKEWKAMLDEILQKISENEYGNPEVEQKLILLSDKLSRTKGKKVYGYLKRDVKDLIDSIVDLLAEDENISKLYELWYEKKYEILRTYTSEMPPKILLSLNKEFKSIKNEIIREAMRIHENCGQTTAEPQKSFTPHQTGPTVSATAVTRLFKSLCSIFRDKIDDRKQKSLPTIDKRQKKEIEEKKNAEISMQ